MNGEAPRYRLGPGSASAGPVPALHPAKASAAAPGGASGSASRGRGTPFREDPGTPALWAGARAAVFAPEDGPRPDPARPPRGLDREGEASGLSVARWLRSRTEGPMPRRAILLHAPSWAFQAPGGGECQLIQTGRHLERLGHVVRPFCPWTDRLREARLLHLFGMSREGLELARLARAAKIPVVLSPICWVEPRSLMAIDGGLARRAWNLAKWGIRVGSPWGLGWRARLLGLCDLILPNSEAEGRQLTACFGADPGRIHVVPNGVEERFAAADPEPFRTALGAEPFVFYAGRIEPRKNVLGLIRGLKPTGLPLTVMGDPVPGHERYAEACRQAGRSFVRWLGRREHDDPLLASAYASARVFALPSWFETPGLAALEAALAGCAVVVTPFGSTREYFGDLVEYALPGCSGSIGSAVLRAWERGPDARLAERVRNCYLWSDVATRTAEAYARVSP